MVQSQTPASTGVAGGPATRTTQPTAGSQTETQSQTQPILVLRGDRGPRSQGPRVQWDESVVDNEGMGKKSSKVCCIYHAPTAPGESSDESDSSSSSSSSDSDSDAGEGSSRRAVDADRVGKEGRSHGRGRRPPGGGDSRGKRRKPSPNAYEKVPKPKPRDGAGGGGTV
ncbi:hypothetical protein M406DRAFT_322333 [Cryphonectria parasitica EP155]|uniref:Type 1 phosphatases regulator n=1 Tax=Cryphonectria parasitica (strain ATCC 38755 / EP155) TaxID=660469 RepID=A0A9P5CQD7_CRYP1|nr:uncharacterized protein M406DRAFT_322333 [Cryphonectria parasitica EP155]KAF3766337.1 hypothetical protein M406DRAFT_322333 [Cryphonectria parasitica EP155]